MSKLQPSVLMSNAVMSASAWFIQAHQGLAEPRVAAAGSVATAAAATDATAAGTAATSGSSAATTTTTTTTTARELLRQAFTSQVCGGIVDTLRSLASWQQLSLPACSQSQLQSQSSSPMLAQWAEAALEQLLVDVSFLGHLCNFGRGSGENSVRVLGDHGPRVCTRRLRGAGDCRHAGALPPDGAGGGRQQRHRQQKQCHHPATHASHQPRYCRGRRALPLAVGLYGCSNR